MHDQLRRCQAEADECQHHALMSDDLVIKLGYVTLILEWHELAKEIEILVRRRLEHEAEPLPVLKSLWRALAPGGFAVVHAAVDC
jgi:hypothetical protein